MSFTEKPLNASVALNMDHSRSPRRPARTNSDRARGRLKAKQRDPGAAFTARRARTVSGRGGAGPDDSKGCAMTPRGVWRAGAGAERGGVRPGLHQISPGAEASAGSINTPLELAMDNQVDRFTLAMDVIDRVPRLRSAGAHEKERFRNRQIECRLYAHEHGVDPPEIAGWRWTTT